MASFAAVLAAALPTPRPFVDPAAAELLAPVDFTLTPGPAWTGTLATGGAVEISAPLPGVLRLRTPAGSARITHPSEAAAAPGDRETLAAVAALYRAADPVAIAVAEARHLVRTHDWGYSYSDDADAARRGQLQRQAMLAALRRLPFEVAAELYDAHAPPEFFRYAPSVHGAAA